MSNLSDTKAFQMRMPKSLWQFLKIESVFQEDSINNIIIAIVNNARLNSSRRKYIEENNKKDIDLN